MELSNYAGSVIASPWTVCEPQGFPRFLTSVVWVGILSAIRERSSAFATQMLEKVK